MTFSDGRKCEFSAVEVLDDRTLLGSVRREFTPTMPAGLDPKECKWEGGPAVVVDTVHFAAHEWSSISVPPRSVLCAVVRNATPPARVVSLHVVESSVGHDTDVPGLIGAWLAERDQSFQGYYGSIQDKRYERAGVVPEERERALAAGYLFSGSGRDEVRKVKFSLQSPEPVANSFDLGLGHQLGGGLLK
ncbi:hypothetical protein [Mycobacteroides chelonae]|uniref:hypothetical protein n=1 Tax=Mycobacteroides chelonae TaxID=1774 RepID=UPI0010427E4C|nr:hypothetical protein [Mycobacteroides chelonae]